MRNTTAGHFSNSIQDSENGQWLETVISEAAATELQNLDRNWLFDWKTEAKRNRVFKLVLAETPKIIQGLISLEQGKGFYFVSLLENAPQNRGKDKKFRGVPGNLFAFACKMSDENGFDGFVVFEAKTALIEHYKNTLGAQTIGNSIRMFIDEIQAQKLILFHFPKP